VFKKLIVVVLCMALLITACGQSIKASDGQVYECYGLLDKDKIKKDNMVYDVVIENVVLSVIFCETVFIPIWLIGFQLYCPANQK